MCHHDVTTMSPRLNLTNFARQQCEGGLLGGGSRRSDGTGHLGIPGVDQILVWILVRVDYSIFTEQYRSASL